jgi:hypothetical protein
MSQNLFSLLNSSEDEKALIRQVNLNADQVNLAFTPTPNPQNDFFISLQNENHKKTEKFINPKKISDITEYLTAVSNSLELADSIHQIRVNDANPITPHPLEWMTLNGEDNISLYTYHSDFGLSSSNAQKLFSFSEQMENIINSAFPSDNNKIQKQQIIEKSKNIFSSSYVSSLYSIEEESQLTVDSTDSLDHFLSPMFASHSPSISSLIDIEEEAYLDWSKYTPDLTIPSLTPRVSFSESQPKLLKSKKI